MAMMITSSPEDISNLTTTIKLIRLIQNMLGDHATYIEYGDSKINNTEIEHISNYFTGIYYILTNPATTEKTNIEYIEYQESLKNLNVEN